MHFKLKYYKNHLLQRAKSENYEKAMDISQGRISFLICSISFAFIILMLRLFYLSVFTSVEDIRLVYSNKSQKDFVLKRASIVDRNGELLATNIATASLYTIPKNLIHPEESARQIVKVLPQLKLDELITKFTSNKGFIWIKRHLTPKEQQAIHNLGIAGIYFTRDEKRVYPQTHLFSHSVGYVDIDGKGLAGVERYFDNDLTELTSSPLELSLDLRIQSILREELQNAITANQAVGASGLVMDVNNGQVISMVSLPDFNPNRMNNVNDRQKFNQVTLGSYEMGSVFKIFNTAAAFDLRRVDVNDYFDVSMPYKIANFSIKDYRSRKGELSIPEILIYSSNRGTAQIAEKIGVQDQKLYMKKFGFLDKLNIELSEISSPRYPSNKRWNEVSMVTISYGHGIAVNELHLARAVAASVNGGKLVQPTLLKHHANNQDYPQVIKPQTSELMRKMLRLVVTGGSGKKANVDGYFIGGKSGTPEKICGKGYCKHSNLSLFVGVYPIYDPKYLVLVMVDEAKPTKFNNGLLGGGSVSSYFVGQTIKRASPILGVHPELDGSEKIAQALSLDFIPRYRKINH